MSIWHIYGGNRMTGSTQVQGAKNAVLPIMAASVLAGSETVLHNVPDLKDVTITLRILRHLGCTAERDGDTVRIDSRGMNRDFIPHDLMRELRSSVIFLGAILTRFGTASLSMPGGCELGPRPVNLHLDALRALGAEVTERGGDIVCCAHDLKGRRILLPFPSVGATENAMLAALGADGCTTIENAAKEPHIVDLANFLNSMGADIKGAGTDSIKIRGVKRLTGGSYGIIPDQIEAGTYMAAVAATGGQLLLKNVIPKHMECISAKLMEMGVSVTEDDDSLLVRRSGPLTKTNVKTLPYPGFPTDMQPQITAVLALAEGTSLVTEGVYGANRFKYVDELKRLGAHIQVDGKVAVVEGVKQLVGAPIQVCDLRAGAALVIAGLAAQGTTELSHINYIERGYENLVGKLRAVGADISLVDVPDEADTETHAG